MPWNEPGSGNSNDRDPWGNGKNNNGNKSPDIEEVINNVRKRFGGSNGSSNNGGMGFKSQLLIALIVLTVFVGMRSVYTVQEGQESIELRFGKFSDIVGPGLQFVIWPIEEQITIESTNIRTVEVGFRKDTDTQQSVRAEAQMLTTDENIADVSLAVQYNIKNVKDLVFKVGNVERPGTVEAVVRGATESALREVVGSTTMDDLFNQGRSAVETKTKALLQVILDRYETGINVVAVEMQAAVPPKEVQAAFDNVNKADQVEQQLIKNAKAYEETVLNEAEGSAARLLAEANGYKEAVIANASGESQRFIQILTEYKKAPEITRKRLYIETMEQVLGDANKVVIDQSGNGGNNIMYLPLDQIMKNSQSQPRSSSSLRSVSGSNLNSSINSIIPKNTNIDLGRGAGH